MSKEVLLLLVIFAAVVIGSYLDDEWSLFKKRYNKQYGEAEDALRKMIWEEKITYIQRHNDEAARGIQSYTMGINSYSDLSHEEFVKTMTGLKVSEDRIPGKKHVSRGNLNSLPDHWNWTALGYVTEVGNQLQCGSCWAFSVLGALEGQWFKAEKNLVRLSVQDLMDCSTKIGNDGCEGGYMDRSYQFIQDNKGVDTWASYPYEAKNGKCRHRNDTIGATDYGYADIPKGIEDDLLDAVFNVGPIAVAVDGYQESFSQYKGGVYDEPKCSSTQLSHTLLVVGYGTYQGKDYWLAKNSWGTSWGIDGYIMMSRNKNNQCGIASLASYPLVLI